MQFASLEQQELHLSVLLRGQTLHSAIGIGIDFNKISEPSDTQKKAWANILILVIDESSFLDASMVAVLEDRLPQLKQNTLSFGGLLVLFVGSLRHKHNVYVIIFPR